MGARVVRVKTLGISSGNPASIEPRLDDFNDAAFAPIDFALYEARRHGLKLVGMFTDACTDETDDSCYYHGCICTWTRWFNRTATATTQRRWRHRSFANDYEHFFNDRDIIDAFKRYITHFLNHTNPLTGLRLADDDTLSIWETANELPWSVPRNWTREITIHIKSLAPKSLVLSGRYGVAVDELTIPELDGCDDHFYPAGQLLRLEADVAMTSLAQKVFIAGEYDWSKFSFGKEGSIAPFLSAVLKNDNIAGAMYWSLHSHWDSFGYQSPTTPIHYPGEDAFVRGNVVEQMEFCANMSGEAPPTKFVDDFTPTRPPLLNAFATGRSSSADGRRDGGGGHHVVLKNVTWRGSAGACSYNVELHQSSGSSSRRVTVLRSNVTDYELPLTTITVPVNNNNTEMTLSVSPIGCNGVAGPRSNERKIPPA